MLKQISVGTKLYQKVLRGKDQPVAMIDVDDVLFPCTNVLLDHLNKRYSKSVHIDDLENFDLRLQFPEVGNTVFDYLISEYDYMNQDVLFHYAKPMLQRLKDHGFYVAIVTSRGFHPEGYKNTHNMFTRNRLAFDSLATIGRGQSKIDFMYDHVADDLDLVLEDNVSVIKDALTTNAKVVRFDRAWNCTQKAHAVITQDMEVHQVLEEIDIVVDRIKENRRSYA